MALNDPTGSGEGSLLPTRDKLIGVYIGILAVALAICSMGGGNATKNATLSNIEASNTWAFFQAKNMRRQALRLHADDLELGLNGAAPATDEARKAIEAKIADYRANAERLKAEKNEGLDDLFKKGKELEAKRDDALKRDPFFDYGQALLQIAIVLASVAIISGGNALLAGSFILGGLGLLFTIGGFTLAFSLPFV